MTLAQCLSGTLGNTQSFPIANRGTHLARTSTQTTRALTRTQRPTWTTQNSKNPNHRSCTAHCKRARSNCAFTGPACRRTILSTFVSLARTSASTNHRRRPTSADGCTTITPQAAQPRTSDHDKTSKHRSHQATPRFQTRTTSPSHRPQTPSTHRSNAASPRSTASPHHHQRANDPPG